MWRPSTVTPTGSYFSEFAVGKIGDVFRENTGKLLKAGSRFTFSSHYHSVGEDVTAHTGRWPLVLSAGGGPEVPRVRPSDGRTAGTGNAGHPTWHDQRASLLHPATGAGQAGELSAAHARTWASRCRWK